VTIGRGEIDEQGKTMTDLMGLQDQPALVVGGGFGIGAATARLLATAGARVAVADRDGDRAAAVADEIDGHPIAGDVTLEGGAREVVDTAHRVLGGLKKVANIVGLGDFREFTATDTDQWDAQLRINLLQQMWICHAAGRHMLAEGGGAIAMVSSVSAIYGARNHVAYGAAKAGVNSLARSLSDEWAGHGIRLNTVAPDVIATPRLTAMHPGGEDQARAAMDATARADGVPIGRFGRPEEIAGPLLFLLSDLSSFITGQCLVVDGGTMIHFPHGGSGPATAPQDAQK
jgi:NAD(P)-dependent dehydrogenase (short-subunit alcohol dehydrogenase family)